MFNREENSGAAIDTLISRTTRIQGDIDFSGGLHLEGQVTGSVRATGEGPSRLVISPAGVIEGSVVASVVEVQGAVRGDIHAATRVVLGAGARVEGNLQYGTIEMAAGALIKGKLVKLDRPGA
jgi:cytoskeletal protein CcmA (bactofilin family)